MSKEDAQAIQEAIKKLDFKPSTEVSEAAARTAETIQLYSAFVRRVGNEANKDRDNKTIDLIYKRFFDFADGWLINQGYNAQDVEKHKDLNIAQLKKKANDAIKDIQRNIVRFATIYMNIDRCIGIVGKESAEQEKKLTEPQDFKWSPDAADVLKKYKEQRLELGDLQTRLNKGRQVVTKIEPYYAEIAKIAGKVAGKDQSEKLLRSFRSGIRVGDFKKSRDVLKKITESKGSGVFKKKPGKKDIESLLKNAELYLQSIEKSQDFLKDQEGKFYYSEAELNVALETLAKELGLKDQHIEKYYGPYLKNKRKRFIHLREKLLVFGSLQGLITLYMKLIRGLASPMKDIQLVRQYEAEVIQHVDYILSGQFQEIENIEKRTEEDMEDFYDSVQSYKKIIEKRKTKEAEKEKTG